jgi:tetratricopeptide (TPR) repeat protein
MRMGEFSWLTRRGDYILRGRAARLRPHSRDSFAEAISLFEHALALDPRSVEAQTQLAGSLAGLRVFYGANDLVAADLARADVLIGRALAAAPRHSLAHHVKGQVLRAQNRWEEAIIEYETALALNPNLVVALNGLGWCKLFAGSVDEVIPLMQQAIRRSPRDPQMGTWYAAIGMVHLLQTRIDEAVVCLEKARSNSPDKPYNHLHLAAAYGLSGDLDRAALELAEARRLDAGTLYSSIAQLKAFPGAWWGVPNIRTLYEATYFAGLRKAGMPETWPEPAAWSRS